MMNKNNQKNYSDDLRIMVEQKARNKELEKMKEREDWEQMQRKVATQNQL